MPRPAHPYPSEPLASHSIAPLALPSQPANLPGSRRAHAHCRFKQNFCQERSHRQDWRHNKPLKQTSPHCRWITTLGLLSLAVVLQAAQNQHLQSVPVAPPAAANEGFTRIAPPAAGISFTNWISEDRHLTNQILLNGSGVAAGDVDGDGWCDLYFCSVDAPNALYRNAGGWKFEDITERAGVACADLSATGAAFGDLDGDGDLDLIVNSVGGGTHVFYNDGKGRFRKMTQLNGRKGGMSIAISDLDGDGDLDLYLTNYRTSALMDMPNARAVFKPVGGSNAIERINGRPLTDPDLTNRFTLGRLGSIEELGEVDGIYRNEGGTNFVEVSFTGGQFLDENGAPLTKPPFEWGLSVMCRDLTGDGWPDIYVCNDFESPDRFWINLRDGRFQMAPRLALRKSSYFSMGMDVADVNRDGWDDLLVMDMLNRTHLLRMTQMLPLTLTPADVTPIEARPQYMLSTLFLNRGDGKYAEISQMAGLEASDWSWMPVFLDVDLDGWEDLLISTGHERAARDLDIAEQIRQFRRSRRSVSDTEIFQARRAFPRLTTGNLAFRNRGDLTFEERSAQWGFDQRGVSQGMTLADLDNDGDLDVLVNTSNEAPGLYRNDSPAPRVAVRLKGLSPNTQGIGARIQVRGGALPAQHQEMIGGGRYLSCGQALRTFAAGHVTNRLQVEVTWRSGKVSVLSDLAANHIYEIDEAGAVVRAPAANSPAAGAALPATLFADASELLGHAHEDPFFDDFSRQPLLPNRLSQLGPGAAWWDVDADGWTDLIIGSGKSGRMAVFLNKRTSGFERMNRPPFMLPVTRDQTTILGWQRAPGDRVLLAGSSNYEDGLALGASVRGYPVGRNAVEELLPPAQASSGPLALADIDGNGSLDLFVGGRVVPGKYPQAASSALYRNTQGKFQLDAANAKTLAGAGLVSGAVFSDIDGDGDADLILACEWGPIRWLRNDRGQFTDATESAGLGSFTGWWNGVTTGDFDGDGQLDIAASNWGRNTKYQSHRAQPLRIYYGDFDGDGTGDLIEAHFDEALRKWVPERQLGPMAQAMPFLRGRVSSHRAYADAEVDQLLAERAQYARFLEAQWLESTVFLNRGGRFEARVLPAEAQMAPAFGICVADADGDGHEDLFLAQNFFAVQLETPRYDAGRGLWLRGDGKGGFAALPGQTSGVAVYGEQRGSAVCDFDQDGRADLVVTQNGAPTRLFRNVGGTPGLLVRLRGTGGNPDGIGASIRVEFGQRLGPMREIHAGSGYWSQDGAEQVVALPEKASAIVIRWPGGRQTRTILPAGARSIQVNQDGKLL